MSEETATVPAKVKKFLDKETQEICTLDTKEVPVVGGAEGQKDLVITATYNGGHSRVIEGSLDRFVEIPDKPVEVAPKNGGAEPVKV